MRNFIIWGAIALSLASGVTGCVSAEAKAEISTNAASSDGVLRLWDELTPDQRKQAYWKQARAWHNLDFSVNDVTIPPEFLQDPWAGTAPVTTGGQ